MFWKKKKPKPPHKHSFAVVPNGEREKWIRYADSHGNYLAARLLSETGQVCFRCTDEDCTYFYFVQRPFWKIMVTDPRWRGYEFLVPMGETH